MRIASSHLITTCATAAAIILFVALGSQVLPAAFGGSPADPNDSALSVAFLLNIAIILFGWRRSKDLRDALAAYEKAERLAERNANYMLWRSDTPHTPLLGRTHGRSRSL